MQDAIQNNVDVKENLIIEKNPELLELLLKDCTTKRNIIWATNDYFELGTGYSSSDEITVEAITGKNGNIIMPRSVKSKEMQGNRTRNMAEVFTPTWICNKMNNLVDSAWFGRENVFNEEVTTNRNAFVEKITFPNKTGASSWMDYIAAKRLEITCGEAPYLVSRYDTVTGDIIPLENRIGILDRKLRIINEKVRNFKDTDRAKKRWLQLAKLAVQSTYGFEWQGDNVLLARENLLYTVSDYFEAKFNDVMATEWLLEMAKIIAWNIWQMDGIKCVVPNSCHDYKKQRKPVEPSLFDVKAFGITTLKRSMSLCDVNENELQKCQGCLKDNLDLHNGVYCKIKNWTNGKVYKFKDLLSKQESEAIMCRDFKFDVVIGNPPYQAESTETVSTTNNQKPVKNVFQHLQQGANLLSRKKTCLIYPGGRWIHRFGKGLQEFGLEQINDTTLEKVIFYPLAHELFEKVQIADGITIVVKNKDKTDEHFVYEYCQNNSSKSVIVKVPGENLLPLNPRDIEICEKIDAGVRNNRIAYLHDSILPRSLFRIESNFVEENPDKVREYSQNEEYDKQKYIKLFTNDKAGKMGRAKWYLADKDVITSNLEYIKQWQVVVSSANAGGQKRDNQIEIIDDNSAFGRSRVALRSFVTREEAINFFEYANTYLIKYAFLMTDESLTSLGKRVPDILNYQNDNGLVNFSNDLNEELYTLFKLTENEIAYIEEKVKSIRSK